MSSLFSSLSFFLSMSILCHSLHCLLPLSHSLSPSLSPSFLLNILTSILSPLSYSFIIASAGWGYGNIGDHTGSPAGHPPESSTVYPRDTLPNSAVPSLSHPLAPYPPISFCPLEWSLCSARKVVVHCFRSPIRGVPRAVNCQTSS